VIDKNNPNIKLFNQYVKTLDKYNKKKQYRIKWNPTFNLDINTKIQHMFVLVGFPGYDYHNSNKYIISFINAYLSNGMSSVLFNKVRNEKGLVYHISSFHKCFDDTGVFAFKFSVKDVNRLIETLYITLNECKKMKDNELDNDIVDKIRTSLISSFSFMHDNSYSIIEFLGIQYLNHPKSIKTTNEIIDIYKNITAKNIQMVAKDIFDFKKLQISIVSHTKFDKHVINTIVNKVINTSNSKKSNSKKSNSKKSNSKKSNSKKSNIQ
jgi:predicted Zn-dependent peptidase